MNNPPSLSSLLSRIKDAHQRCKRGSVEAINAAVECGLLLIELRKIIKPREWNSTLQTIDFPQRTAWNYMRIAEKWDGNLLQDGIYFCNLLRDPDFSLLPELEGGGRRLGKAELERRRRADQLLFHFERVEPAFAEVLRYNGGANPLLAAPQETIEQAKRVGERLQKWADEAGRGEIEV